MQNDVESDKICGDLLVEALTVVPDDSLEGDQPVIQQDPVESTKIIITNTLATDEAMAIKITFTMTWAVNGVLVPLEDSGYTTVFMIGDCKDVLEPHTAKYQWATESSFVIREFEPILNIPWDIFTY